MTMLPFRNFTRTVKQAERGKKKRFLKICLECKTTFTILQTIGKSKMSRVLDDFYLGPCFWLWLFALKISKNRSCFKEDREECRFYIYFSQITYNFFIPCTSSVSIYKMF